MKTLIALSVILFAVAIPFSLRAADISVDIASIAPHDPTILMRHIEINVLIKQYEKAAFDLDAAQLELQLGSEQNGQSDEQRKLWAVRMKTRCDYLAQRKENSHEKIKMILEEVRRFELELKADAEKKENAKAGASQ